MSRCKIVLLSVFLLLTTLTNSTKAEESLDLARYQGKVLYLDFWASWCIPCRKSFPWMNDLRSRYSEDELAIVAVNLDKEKKLANAFLKEYPAAFKIAFDPKGQLAKGFKIPGMPSSILFDAKGQVISVHSGFFKKQIAKYESQIEAAVLQHRQQVQSESE